jgi:hypothetical protein
MVLVARPVRSRPMFAPMMIHQFRCGIRRSGFATDRHHFRDGDVVRRDSNRAGSIRDGVVVRHVLFVVKLVLSLFRLPFVGDELLVLILVLRVTLPFY